MAIHLDLTLPPGSSSLPEGFGRAALKRLLLGLAPDEACHAADCYQWPGGLLHRRFTLTYRSKPISGLFSAALSLRSPWADVIRHRALWSPEVPQLFWRFLPMWITAVTQRSHNLYMLPRFLVEFYCKMP